MAQLKVAFVALAVLVFAAQAKPSHYFGAIPDHFDFTPPVLPPAHFHSAEPALLHEQWLQATAPLWPETGAFIPAPAALPAPPPLAPALPALPPPPPLAPVLPALPAFQALPALPSLPAAPPVFHTHFLPTPELALPAVLPVATPSYRAIPGPKTTTRHVSIGYAFPKLLPAHAHLHAAPLKLARLHHHHTLF